MRSTPSLPAKIDVLTADHCLATWERMYVTVFRGNTTMEGLHAIKAGFPLLANRYPSGVGLFTIVERRAPLPPATVRSAMAKWLAESAPAIKCSAVVFEGDGFSAAAVRGVVTGVTLVARPPYPHKVFPTVRQASAWLAEGFGHAGKPWLSAVELVAAVAELRNRIG